MKKLLAIIALCTVGTAFSATPVANAWNYNYVVTSLRFDTQEKAVWFAAADANDYPGPIYSFRYLYTEPGNTLEEAKVLFSGLSLAKSTNKKVGFVLYGKVGTTVSTQWWRFGSIHVQE